VLLVLSSACFVFAMVVPWVLLTQTIGLYDNVEEDAEAHRKPKKR
jgi:hypothetical protein